MREKASIEIDIYDIRKYLRKYEEKKLNVKANFEEAEEILFLEKNITKSSHNMQEKENSNLFDSIVTKTELFFSCRNKFFVGVVSQQETLSNV